MYEPVPLFRDPKVRALAVVGAEADGGICAADVAVSEGLEACEEEGGGDGEVGNGEVEVRERHDDR